MKREFKAKVFAVISITMALLALQAKADGFEDVKFSDTLTKTIGADEGFILVDKENKNVLGKSFTVIGSLDKKNMAYICELVGEDSRCGFINEKLEVVIPLEYRAVTLFNGNWAVALKTTGKWIFINRQNKQSFPTEVDSIEIPYSDHSDWSGDPADDLGAAQSCENNYNLIPAKIGKRTVLVRKTGKIYLDEKASSVDCSTSKTILVYKQNNTMVLINQVTKARTVIKVPAKMSPSFSAQLGQALGNDIRVPVCTKNKDIYEQKCGISDVAGKLIVPAEYETADILPNGLIVLGKKIKTGSGNLDFTYKYGVMDKELKLVNDFTLDDAPDFDDVSEGLTAIIQNSKVGYMDDSGKIVIAAQFDNEMPFLDLSIVGAPFKNGLAVIAIGKKLGYIDHSGTVVIPAIYDNADWFSNKGTAHVTLNEKQFLINKQGVVVKNLK